MKFGMNKKQGQLSAKQIREIEERIQRNIYPKPWLVKLLIISAALTIIAVLYVSATGGFSVWAKP